MIIIGDWGILGGEALRIRTRVFVEEQGVPLALEQDESDPGCVHVLCRLAGDPVATGRLLLDGHLGRICVLPEWRGKGYGALIVQALLDEARRRGMHQLALSAQINAMGLYARYGFQPVGEPYLEAGILHQAMERKGS